MSRKGWLRLAAACAVAFVVLTVPVSWGRNWPGEWAIVHSTIAARSAFWTAVMQTVTFFGSSAVGLGVSTGLSAIQIVRERLFRHLWRDRRLVWKALWPLLAMVGAAPVNFGLRWAVGRYRPGVTYIPHKMPELRHPFQAWSYPSGHAMTATICYGALAVLLCRWMPRARRWWLGLYVVWLALTGFSRIYLGVHWPTDVLAGYLAGGGWLALCLGVFMVSRPDVV